MCLDSYPETDFELIEEAGVQVITLDRDKIQKWVKKLIDVDKKQVISK